MAAEWIPCSSGFIEADIIRMWIERKAGIVAIVTGTGRREFADAVAAACS